MRHSLGRLSNEEGDVNKNGKKSIGFDWQNKTLHVHHDFLYISLPSLHDYNVKVISRFVEDASTRQRLLFLSLNFYRTTKVSLRQPSMRMVCRPSEKNVSRPRPLHFLEAASLFYYLLLVTFVRIKTNRRKDCYPFCSVWHERRYETKKKITRAFRQAKS